MLKVIYLISNPRDVAVSGYYFWNATDFIKIEESLEGLFEKFLQGKGKCEVQCWSGNHGLFLILMGYFTSLCPYWLWVSPPLESKSPKQQDFSTLSVQPKVKQYMVSQTTQSFKVHKSPEMPSIFSHQLCFHPSFYFFFYERDSLISQSGLDLTIYLRHSSDKLKEGL